MSATDRLRERGYVKVSEGAWARPDGWTLSEAEALADEGLDEAPTLDASANGAPDPSAAVASTAPPEPIDADPEPPAPDGPFEREEPRDEADTEHEALTAAVESFQRWLYLPDASPLYAVLGAVAANRLDADPVWLLLVAAASSGKTEILSALAGLPDVHPAATLTEASLLSGTPKREAKEAKGGLLREIGEYGIVSAKDFGSVLSMNRDTRALVLAALREIYDGSWTRHVGTDGGRTLSWSGKVGFVGGCTPTIDRHHAVMGAMGDRFLLLRFPETTVREQASRALGHGRTSGRMREELRSAVAGLFESELREPRERSAAETERLIDLAVFVARARSAVERDGYSREIELIPGAEAPARLVQALANLLAGLDIIGVRRKAAWRVVAKAARDSIPALRLEVLAQLADGEERGTPALAAALGYPTTTTRRALEDLAAYDLVLRIGRGTASAGKGGSSDQWKIALEAALGLEILGVPEKSPPMRKGKDKREEHLSTDVSGTPVGEELF